jgi:fructose-1,6-bisphosphatase/inositol monophosphatase family enzyme
MTELNGGFVNGHIVGRILKEAVRRAVVVIRNERAIFESTAKIGYSGDMDDVFTSADKKAQEVYLRTFQECFPWCGVIGEEDSLSLPPQKGYDAYFTVDPLDGTKAYVRRQSHGVGTMVALVAGGEIVSAYVGDVNADEIYGYRPGSNRVWRITRLDSFEELGRGEPVSVGNFFALLRDPEHRYSSETQALLGKFKNYEAMGSSIGTWLARLWKREVSAAILPPSFETPWDSTPVVGISKKLGYVFMRPDVSAGGWEVYEPPLVKKPEKRSHDTLVIHPEDALTLGIL